MEQQLHVINLDDDDDDDNDDDDDDDDDDDNNVYRRLITNVYMAMASYNLYIVITIPGLLEELV